jgi:acetyltransferase-like isoleucine patch superfamily enzyme
MNLKTLLVRIRNHLHPINRYRIHRTTQFLNKANIKNTRITDTGRNTIIFEDGVRLTDLVIILRGHSNLLSIGRNSRVRGRIELYGDSNQIKIGANTKINGAFIGAHNGTTVTIGSNCLFSTGIELRTTDSHKIFDESGARINPDQNIVIEDRVWLGLSVYVLKGSWISSDTVIGARSMVTGRIPPKSIAAGVPARVLKSGITWEE